MEKISTGTSLTRRLFFIVCIATLSSTLAYSISLLIPKKYCLESHIHLDGAMSPSLARHTIYYLEHFLFRTRLVEEKISKLMGNPITVERLTAARKIALYRDSLSAHIILFWPEPEEGKRLLDIFTSEAVELAVNKTLIDKKRELHLLAHKIGGLKQDNLRPRLEVSISASETLLDQYQRELIQLTAEVSSLTQEIESLRWKDIISGSYLNPKLTHPLTNFNALVGLLIGALVAILIIGVKTQRIRIKE